MKIPTYDETGAVASPDAFGVIEKAIKALPRPRGGTLHAHLFGPTQNPHPAEVHAHEHMGWHPPHHIEAPEPPDGTEGMP